MASKFSLGAAGFVLLATAGAAQAADVLPTIISTTPTAPATAGSTVALQLDASLEAWLDFGYPPGFSLVLGYVVDFQRPTGWSFELLGGGGFDIGLPLIGGMDLTARAYQTFSRATIGIYGYVGSSIPFGMYGYGVGWDLEVETGNVTIHNDNWLDLTGGLQLNDNTEVEFTVRDRVTISAGFYLGWDFPGLYADIHGRAEVDVGDFTPYIFAWWSPTDADFGAGVGVDVEHPIGTGPLSLIGNVELERWPGGTELSASIGIRFNRGEVNTPWWW